MKICWLIIYFLLFGQKSEKAPLHASSLIENNSCLAADEKELYNLIMKYRKTKKLPEIPLSKSLTYVAQVHAKDLYENRADKDPCNQHSWSDKGSWKACCYYPDHRNKECMWDKPKELTNYSAPGFEIAYFHSAAAEPGPALEAWKKSPGHNSVIINSTIWRGQKWNAIGIGIYKNYATVGLAWRKIRMELLKNVNLE